MNKQIKIVLEVDNAVKIICGDNEYIVKDNTISAKDVYDLISYNVDCDYSVTTEIKGSKSEIIIPLENMFDTLLKKLNELKSINFWANKDMEQIELNELESDK